MKVIDKINKIYQKNPLTVVRVGCKDQEMVSFFKNKYDYINLSYRQFELIDYPFICGLNPSYCFFYEEDEKKVSTLLKEASWKRSVQGFYSFYGSINHDYLIYEGYEKNKKNDSFRKIKI